MAKKQVLQFIVVDCVCMSALVTCLRAHFCLKQLALLDLFHYHYPCNITGIKDGEQMNIVQL